MALDSTTGKAYNQGPDLCWECYTCVEMCPNSAIDMRGYADVMPMGATLRPVRGTHSIIWTANYRDGRIKRFKLPIRTTPWGSIATFPDDARPRKMGLKSPELFGERIYLGVDRLPVPGAAPGASRVQGRCGV